jgi:Tfp pilus assembly protein PilE
MIELLIVLVILAIVSLFGYPALHKLILRNRLQGYAKEMLVMMQLARQEAVRAGHPMVVDPDYAGRALVVWGDVNGNGNFDYDAGKAHRASDFEVSRLPLPGGATSASALFFMGPSQLVVDDDNPGDSVDGLAASNNVMVFRPDGGVRAQGAIRVSDRRGNVLEARVMTAATGKMDLLKYNPDPPGDLEPGFYRKAPYDGKTLWEWYSSPPP